MKNGTSKNNTAKKTRPVAESLREYWQKHRNDLSKIYVLLGLSLVCALLIQERIGIDHFIGSFLITAIILFIFYRDIKRYKPVYLNDHKMLMLLGLLVAGTLMSGRISEYLLSGLHRGLVLPSGGAFLYGIPVPMGAMLVTLIFDFHTAIIFSFITSLMTGIWLNNPLYTVYAFIGSLTAAFSVIRCKRRSALLKGGLYVSAVNVLTTGVLLLFEGNLFAVMAPNAFMFAAMSGIMVAAIVSLLLPVIEYVFSVSTDISLIELMDLDQPLMHNLMIAAPGTYHHSIIVGNLAESAAEAVGANPLLARVTACYHDIGKMRMPEYFVENQSNSTNKHEKLTPHMSSMILISHVKDGVELARQYKMPKQIADIIQQHHGTSLITFFYQKALEQTKDGLPLREDYRYPGPKPQTRVAAIVMMADAVEAASRALAEPTPARISALVDKIINHIFLDGQIDECELSLKDISEIKKRFTYILTSIFHRRIEYPEIVMKGQHKVTSEPAWTRTAGDRGAAGKLPQGYGNINKEQPKADQDKISVHKEGAQ
ncbi:MAG TPA: HDIG domain-containing protein [Dissulfurispiraceae bacterium]|nr:HDIG domain-containing protein [Dissulfurispiraceae bacterium]